MKMINRILYAAVLSLAFITIFAGCKEDKLVFPEQIKIDGDGNSGTSRGPIKQNNLTVTTNEDELVSFDIQNVDRERVVSLFFSHNQNGEAVATEVVDFEKPYVIKNLPVKVPVDILVWAKDKNGNESKKAVYAVTPKPFPASIVIETFNITGGVLSATIDVSNLTSASTTLFYKIDNAPSYTQMEVERPSTNKKIEIAINSIGQHTIAYYFTDVTGGKSVERTATFNVAPPELFNYNTAAMRAGWTPYASNSNSTSEGPPSFMLDGNSGTIWHTQWSTTTTSSHTAIQKYPFTLIFTFTETRVTSASGLFNEEPLKAPVGPYKPIAVKEVSLLHRAVNNYRVKDVEIYGIESNGSEVKLGNFTLSNTAQETVINLSTNTKLFKALKIICLNTFHATDRFANLNEIYVKGHHVAY